MEGWQNAMTLAMQNRNNAVRFTKVEADICNRYIRQATAHEKLGNNTKAKGCLERGLRIPALQNNEGLMEQLKKVENKG